MNRIYFLIIFIYIFSPLISLYGSFQHYFAFGAAASSCITNAVQFRILGIEDVADSIKKQAHSVFAELQLPEPEKIPVKRMSSLLLACARDSGCIATHNAIFVDEEWLLSLPKEKLRFVLAHEAMHLKNRDMAKRIGAGLVLTVLGITAVCNYKKLGLAGLGTYALGSAAAFAALSRYQEGCADAGAERIALHAFHDHYQVPSGQNLCKKVWNWLGSWFSHYPIDRFKMSV